MSDSPPTFLSSRSPSPPSTAFFAPPPEQPLPPPPPAGPDGDHNRQLYVGGLPLDVDKGKLEVLFGAYGELESVRIIPPTNPAHTYAIAFVVFTSGESAWQALHYLNGSTVNGSVLRVQWAQTSRAASSSTSSSSATAAAPPQGPKTYLPPPSSDEVSKLRALLTAAQAREAATAVQLKTTLEGYDSAVAGVKRELEKRMELLEKKKRLDERVKALVKELKEEKAKREEAERRGRVLETLVRGRKKKSEVVVEEGPVALEVVEQVLAEEREGEQDQPALKRVKVEEEASSVATPERDVTTGGSVMDGVWRLFGKRKRGD